jgi:threonine/homoserine/homoserine lactone efflux protein
MNLLESAAFGLVLGFSLAVPPGPMNAWIASVAARSYRDGVVTGVGAMSADGILGAVVFSLSAFVDLHPFVRPVDAIGAVALTYFGLRILLRRADDAAAPAGVGRTYSRAIVLGLTNPFQIVWWLTAGLAFARLGGAVLLVGLFGGIAVWVLGFPYAVRRGVEHRPRLYRAVVVLSGAVMIAFAAYFAWLAA